jgi:hypothetical protein
MDLCGAEEQVFTNVTSTGQSDEMLSECIMFQLHYEVWTAVSQNTTVLPKEQ